MKIIITSITMYDDRRDDDGYPLSAIVPVPKGLKDTTKFIGEWLSLLPPDYKKKMRFQRRIFIADDSVTRERIDHFLLFGEEEKSIREGDKGKFEELNIKELMKEYDASTMAADKTKRLAKQSIDSALRRGDSFMHSQINQIKNDMVQNPDWFKTDSGLIIPN